MCGPFKVFWPNRSANRAYFLGGGGGHLLRLTINYNKSIYCHIMLVCLCAHTQEDTHTHTQRHTHTHIQRHTHTYIRITNYMTLIVSFTSVFLEARNTSPSWDAVAQFVWLTDRLTYVVTNWLKSGLTDCLTGMTQQLLYALSEAPQRHPHAHTHSEAQLIALSQYFCCCPPVGLPGALLTLKMRKAVVCFFSPSSNRCPCPCADHLSSLVASLKCANAKNNV